MKAKNITNVSMKCMISVKRNEFYGKEVNMGFSFGMPENKIYKKGMLASFYVSGHLSIDLGS